MEACQVTQALLLISLLGLLFLLPFLPAASAYLCLSFRVIFTAIAVVPSCEKEAQSRLARLVVGPF